MNIYSSPLAAGACFAGLIAVAAFNSWTSRINQFFFFSRTLDPAFRATAPARRITSAYLKRVWFGFAGSAILLFALLSHTRFSALGCFFIALLAEGFSCCFAFARAHRDAGTAIAASGLPQEHAATEPAKVSVALLGPDVFTPSHLQALILAPLFTAAAWLIPMLTMHMGFKAFTDAIAANHAAFLSGLGLGMLAASIMLYVQLRYFSRHRSPMARFTANGCVQLAWLGALITAFSGLSVPMHLVITPGIRHGLLAIVIGVALIRFLYGWAKIRLFPPPSVERNGDQFWRWGLFYYNPSDPTLFIQHRCAPGYTVNFANAMSWPLTALFVGDLVFLSCMHLHR